MTLWINPANFTEVKSEELFERPHREHRIGMHPRLAQHRCEELALLARLEAEALLPSALA